MMTSLDYWFLILIYLDEIRLQYSSVYQEAQSENNFVLKKFWMWKIFLSFMTMT